MYIVWKALGCPTPRRVILAPENGERGEKGPLCSKEVLKLSKPNAGKANFKVQGHNLGLNFVFNVNEALVICIIIPLLPSFFCFPLTVSLWNFPNIKILKTLKNVLKIITMEEMGEQFLYSVVYGKLVW